MCTYAAYTTGLSIVPWPLTFAHTENFLIPSALINWFFSVSHLCVCEWVHELSLYTPGAHAQKPLKLLLTLYGKKSLNSHRGNAKKCFFTVNQCECAGLCKNGSWCCAGQRARFCNLYLSQAILPPRGKKHLNLGTPLGLPHIRHRTLLGYILCWSRTVLV